MGQHQGGHKLLAVGVAGFEVVAGGGAQLGVARAVGRHVDVGPNRAHLPVAGAVDVSAQGQGYGVPLAEGVLHRGTRKQLRVVALEPRIVRRLLAQGVGLLGAQAGLPAGAAGGPAQGEVGGVHVLVVNKTVRFGGVDGAAAVLGVHKFHVAHRAHPRRFGAGFEAGPAGQRLAVINLCRLNGDAAALVAGQQGGTRGRRPLVAGGQVEQAGGVVAGIVGVGAQAAGGGRVGEGVAQVEVGRAAGPAHVLHRHGGERLPGAGPGFEHQGLVVAAVVDLAGQHVRACAQQRPFRQCVVHAGLAAVRLQAVGLVQGLNAAQGGQGIRSRKLPVEVHAQKAAAVGVGVVAVEVGLAAAAVQGQAGGELAEFAAAVAHVGGAVGALALVFLQVDEDHAGPALRVEAGGRVGQQLDVLNLLGGQGAQQVGQGGAGEGHPLAVEHHEQALAAAQPQVVVAAQGHARRPGQHVERRGAGANRAFGHVHHGAARAVLKQRPVGPHRYFFQGGRGAFNQHNSRQGQPRRRQLQRRAPVPRKPHLRRRHPVAHPAGRFEFKTPLPVAKFGFHHGRVGGLVQGDGGKFYRRAGRCLHRARKGGAVRRLGGSRRCQPGC